MPCKSKPLQNFGTCSHSLILVNLSFHSSFFSLTFKRGFVFHAVGLKVLSNLSSPPFPENSFILILLRREREIVRRDKS